MPESLVSIIIPVFNAEKYLASTLQSAIAQTWQKKEIIIIDDGSTDNSLAIAKTFKGQSVKILNQKNKGASAARNKGLQEAKGEYIQFLDADDLLSPDKIAEQMQELQLAPGKVAVCSTVQFYDGDNHLSCQPSVYDEAFLFNSNNPVYFLVNLRGGYSGHGSMVQPNAWLTPAQLIKKAGNWNEELSVDDDGEFFCRVLLASEGVIKTGGINYYRKSRSRNTLSSTTHLKSFESAIKATDLIKERLKEYLTPAEQYNCFYKTYRGYAINSFPMHKNLSKHSLDKADSIRNMAEVNGILKITLGGVVINFIANNISWKLARYLQYLIRG